MKCRPLKIYTSVQENLIDSKKAKHNFRYIFIMILNPNKFRNNLDSKWIKTSVCFIVLYSDLIDGHKRKAPPTNADLSFVLLLMGIESSTDLVRF
jgi:hypothetical protein